MHCEGNPLCPTIQNFQNFRIKLQFRKEAKDLPNAYGYLRSLFLVVNYKFLWGQRERVFFKVGGATTATNLLCCQIFRVKSYTKIFFIQITLKKHF